MYSRLEFALYLYEAQRTIYKVLSHREKELCYHAIPQTLHGQKFIKSKFWSLPLKWHMMLCLCSWSDRISNMLRCIMHVQKRVCLNVPCHLLSNSLPCPPFTIFRSITIQMTSLFESYKKSIARNGVVATHTGYGAMLHCRRLASWEEEEKEEEVTTVRWFHGR